MWRNLPETRGKTLEDVEAGVISGAPIRLRLLGRREASLGREQVGFSDLLVPITTCSRKNKTAGCGLRILF